MTLKVPTTMVEEAVEIGGIRYIKTAGAVKRVVIVGVNYSYGLDESYRHRIHRDNLIKVAQSAGPRLEYVVMEDVKEPTGAFPVKSVFGSFDEAWASKKESKGEESDD